MCYDAKALLETQLKRAKKSGDQNWIREIEDELIPFEQYNLHHAAGFAHPQLFIYTDEAPYVPKLATWGLIPHWVKDDSQRQQYWNRTLNARGETIFEKPAFRTAAQSHRCLICVDGFYEHHHFKNKTYPYFIRPKSQEPMLLAGLWSEWTSPQTGQLWTSFAIVTTKANPLMQDIHNNPKIEEPRMPFILSEEEVDSWLQPIENEGDQQSIQSMILPFPETELQAHTVRKIRGKDAIGNQPEASEPYDYYEIINKNQTLF